MTPTLTALESFGVEATTAKGKDLTTLMTAATEKVLNRDHNELATFCQSCKMSNLLHRSNVSNKILSQ